MAPRAKRWPLRSSEASNVQGLRYLQMQQFKLFIYEQCGEERMACLDQ